MSEEKPVYKYKRGQASLKEMTGEEVTAFRFMLTKSHLKYLHARAATESVSVAEYLRRLIAADMNQSTSSE